MLRICKKMPRICSVYAKNAAYMLRIWKKCPVYAPYMEKMPRICTYMHVYAPYMLRIFLSITQWKKRIEPEPKKMHLMLACSLRCSSIPKRWGQRTSKFPHVCFEAVTTAIHYLLSWKAFQKDACEIKIAHFLFAQPQPKTFRLRLPQKFPHISIEAVTTAIYVVCCHEKFPRSVSEVKIAHFLMRLLHPLHVVYFVMESFSKVCWWKKWSIFLWYLVHTNISRSP